MFRTASITTTHIRGDDIKAEVINARADNMKITIRLDSKSSYIEEAYDAIRQIDAQLETQTNFSEEIRSLRNV